MGVLGHLAQIGWLALCLFLAQQTRDYAQVWTSNPTLFTLAAQRAPDKPRVLNFYGLTLVAEGRWVEARRAFMAVVAHEGSPRWDRHWAEVGQRNLQILEALSRRYGVQIP